MSNSDLLNRLIKALENYTGTQLHRRLIGVCQEAFWHASTLLAQERSAAAAQQMLLSLSLGKASSTAEQLGGDI